MAEPDDTLLVIAPEFSTVDPVRRSKVLALAALRVSQKVFGDRYNMAVSYLAAHMLTVADRDGGGSVSGAIKSRKEGDLSITYAGGDGSTNSGFGSTSYGQEYLRLIRENTFGPMVSC